MPIKQSVCLPMYTSRMNALDLVALSAEIGYAAVELWGRGPEFEDVVAAARRRGLVVASMIGHGSELNQRAKHDAFEREIRESIDIAARCGIPGLICFSGNRQPGVGEEEAIRTTADGLKRAAPYAEQKGVNLNLELLNSKVDHPGYQCDRTAWGVAVCERVNSPRVKLLYDIYHMQIMEGDVIRTIRSAIRWIGHFHTAGNPDRTDFDDTQEMNYAGICRAIAASGYGLYVGHEFTPKGEVADALRQAFRICNV
jgi:hydroxypyruvate isomerase